MKIIKEKCLYAFATLIAFLLITPVNASQSVYEQFIEEKQKWVLSNILEIPLNEWIWFDDVHFECKKPQKYERKEIQLEYGHLSFDLFVLVLEGREENPLIESLFSEEMYFDQTIEDVICPDNQCLPSTFSLRYFPKINKMSILREDRNQKLYRYDSLMDEHQSLTASEIHSIECIVEKELMQESSLFDHAYKQVKNGDFDGISGATQKAKLSECNLPLGSFLTALTVFQHAKKMIHFVKETQVKMLFDPRPCAGDLPVVD